MSTASYDGAPEQGQMLPAQQRWDTPYCPLFPTIPICQILVPLSGAVGAERALPHAVALAAATGASISLMLVETPMAQQQAGVRDAAAADPTGYLAELRVQLAMRVPRVETHFVQAATAARGVVEAECREGIDLVVLSPRPPSDSASHAMDDLAPELLRHSSAPVLLIPPDTPPPVQSTRVLVALDGSRLAERALFPLVAIANASRPPYITEITLLMATEEQQATSAAAAYLEDVRAALERATAATMCVRAEAVHGRATEVIVRRVHESTTRHCDILAMTTHGYGGYGGIGGQLLGSVPEYVLPRVQVPVLIVNPRRP